ncbi:MAG: hypothetical protein ACP5RN_14340 [Armatimonadota bacterium]
MPEISLQRRALFWVLVWWWGRTGCGREYTLRDLFPTNRQAV